MDRVKEDVKGTSGERNAVLITAGGFAMLALLVGLLTFFVAFAPGH